MGSIDAFDVEHWRNDDYEKISQFDGGGLFHGRSGCHVTNVLLLDALVPWISQGSKERRGTRSNRDNYGILCTRAMCIARYICCNFGRPSFGNIRKARRKSDRGWSGL